MGNSNSIDRIRPGHRGTIVQRYGAGVSTLRLSECGRQNKLTRKVKSSSTVTDQDRPDTKRLGTKAIPDQNAVVR